METRKVMMNENVDAKEVAALKQAIASSDCVMHPYYPNPFLVGRLSPMVCRRASLNAPTTMPKETNTRLYTLNDVVWGSDVTRKTIRVATYKDGDIRNDIELMSAIEDVQVLNDRVIMVKFSDGTTEKAVLDESDTFSVEQGIAICLTKKLLSTLTRGNGGSVYNKLVEYGVKTYEAIEARKAEVAKENAEKAAKAKRVAEKARRKKERKAAEQREADIEIQKEAYLRAMRELNADK